MTAQPQLVPAAHHKYLEWLRKKDEAYCGSLLKSFGEQTQTLLDKVKAIDEVTLKEWKLRFRSVSAKLIASGTSLNTEEGFEKLLQNTYTGFEKCSFVNLAKIKERMGMQDGLYVKAIAIADEEFHRMFQERMDAFTHPMTIKERYEMVSERDRQREESARKFLTEKEELCGKFYQAEKNANILLLAKLDQMDPEQIDNAVTEFLEKSS